MSELKHKTGMDEEVKKFVMDSDVTLQFLNKLEDMLKFLIPHYIHEGKNQLVVGISCTEHRSVTITNETAERIAGLGYGIKTEHRDINKD